jgi:hypothetical protein
MTKMLGTTSAERQALTLVSFTGSDQHLAQVCLWSVSDLASCRTIPAQRILGGYRVLKPGNGAHYAADLMAASNHLHPVPGASLPGPTVFLLIKRDRRFWQMTPQESGIGNEAI